MKHVYADVDPQAHAAEVLRDLGDAETSFSRHLEEYSRTGDPRAYRVLSDTLYETLQRLAYRYIERLGAGATWSARDLVNEVCLKVLQGKPAANSRLHFYRIVAQAMAWVWKNYARDRRRIKRAPPAGQRLSVSEIAAEQEVDLDLLYPALEEFRSRDADGAELIELRFLVGLTNREIAEMLKITPRTLDRHMRRAKDDLWLIYKRQDPSNGPS